MSKSIVFVAGSPTTDSRSSFVAASIARALPPTAAHAHAWSLRDFDAADVLMGRTDAPGVADFLGVVRSADAIVLSSPVYKASYTGALKAILDLVDTEALRGKPALGIATSRAAVHAEAVADAYAALFGFFAAEALPALVVLDHEIVEGPQGRVFSAPALHRVGDAAASLARALGV